MSAQTFAPLVGVVYLAYFRSAIIGELLVEQAGILGVSDGVPAVGSGRPARTDQPGCGQGP